MYTSRQDNDPEQGAILYFGSEEELITAVLTHAEKYWLSIELLTPFCNYRSSVYICGPAKCHMNFYGKMLSRAEKLMQVGYDRLSLLDKSIDRISNMYGMLLQEYDALDRSGIDPKLGKTIKRKLERWFINTAFSATVTGLSDTIESTPQILEILEVYRLTGIKTYLP